MLNYNNKNFEITDYQFAKPYVKQSELCDLFSISNSTLKLWLKTWEDNGGIAYDIGYMPIEGIRETTWDPKKFLLFVVNHKNKNPQKYFEKAQYKNGLTIITTNKEVLNATSTNN